MSISSNNFSSLSQSANGSHTTLQANVFNSSSPSLLSAAQNETVYHVRNSSSTSSTRSGGKDQQQSTTASTTTADGKRIVFVRLTDAAIQQFEKLALDLYGGSRSSSKKTHANPTISCFKRKAPNGLERSEGEITIPSSDGAASSLPEAANVKFPFSITSANNCDPRSSFECVKLRRSVKNSSSGGNIGDGAHLGFFRHQFQVRSSEAESFSSTKRKLQDIQLEESKTKGLASLPEKAGLRKPTVAVSVVANSHSSSNLTSLLSKKVKSHNQPGTLKPVASAAKLSIPPSNYAGASSKKSPGDAVSPLVSTPSTTAVRQQHQQKPIPTSTKVHNHHSTNNSPVIQKTSSPAAAVSKLAAAGQLSGSKTATPQSSSTFPTSDSSKLSHTAPPPVSKTSASSVSPTAPVQTLPPPQKPTGNSGVADKNGDAAAATTAAVSTGISGGKQLAPAVQRPPPPIEKAVLTTTLAANKKESPTASSASGGGGIALLRNGVAPYRAPAITTTQRSGAAVDAAPNRSRQPVNDDSTSPKENFASSSGAYSTFGSSTAATYGGGSSAEHDKMMLDNIDSRPESAYSSGNESSSSTGASNPHHPFSSGNNGGGGGGHQPHATHINSGSNGPGSASSITSNSSSSAATSANHDITSSDAARHDQLLAWSRTIRQCTSFSERQRLTELYTLDWEKYGELRQYIFAVRTKFDDLKADLDMARGRRADHQRISERIRYEYEMEMRHNNYKHKRQHYDRLRAHLTRLSSLIQAYDEKREVQLKNKLMQNGNDVEMVSSGNVTNHMPPLMEHHHHPQQRLVAVGHMRR